ncbi:MAG: hypothetical protein DYG89_34990 [Caldilinea sp. CFX5]|nr:hypothetical protein [Caldilinea sp. CFX5]
MNRFHTGARSLAWLLALLLVACGSQPSATTDTASAPPVAENSDPIAAAHDLPAFDPTNFSNPTTIDNPWLPMTPGAHYVYEGTTVEDDGTVVPHRIEVTITDLTKQIGGIDTVVSWDLDYTDDELVEAELAFYAQDDDGNVWRMGEYPEEYDAGQVVAAPTWIHGFAEAHAGIMMQAAPKIDTPSYAQGWGPAVDWTDRGQVDAIGQEVCLKVDCYQDVLVIAETSQSEVNAFQLKSYAAGVGNIHVGWRGEGEKTQEVLELTEFRALSADELAAARAAALQLEQSGYEQSKDVYAQTPPLVASDGSVVAAPASAGAVAQSNASASPTAGGAEIVVYTADLAEETLYELERWEDPAAAEGELLGVTNYGDELDAPPENDPHALFTVAVEADTPYRCWVHMKVGAPKGVSTANLLWVQLGAAVDANGQERFRPETDSFLTVQGPATEGWNWVPCSAPDGDAAASLIYFAASGETTVRIQAGMEGVGFDQFILSAADYLADAPTAAIVVR